MWFLFVLAIISSIILILCVTLAIAAGLYFLAELVEEYTSITSKIIRYMIWANLVIQFGLGIFESFPISLLLCNVIHQLCNLSILKTFPYFILTSPSFILSLASLGLNHYWAFAFFGTKYFPFLEVLAYFTISLWMIPFLFFVSLSANEYVLPTTSERGPLINNEDDLVSHYFSNNKKKYGLLYFFNYIKDLSWISPQKQF
ncbi:protein TEX261-like [Daphnia pulicaria]|uniref:protein TEX261-like n=1 Tax=Daphnia pulicaria TaxID=35523 RepID=UPI001EE9AF96|nr:protein TEX261-like [Daphnia pulicaria]